MRAVVESTYKTLVEMYTLLAAVLFRWRCEKAEKGQRVALSR